MGTGEFLVAEADESDASFLNLTPVISVVTNIDEDHMDTYGHDFENLKSAFVQFLERLPFYGVAVLCMDDENVRSIRPRVTKPVIGYGLTPDADVRAIDVKAEGTRMSFTLLRPEHAPLPVVLNLPGLHNVRNALAAAAVATLAGVNDEDLVRGLAEFTGVGRRFTQYGDDDRRREGRVARAPRDGGVPAPPLHAHPGLPRRLCGRSFGCRPRRPGGGLSRG